MVWNLVTFLLVARCFAANAHNETNATFGVPFKLDRDNPIVSFNLSFKFDHFCFQAMKDQRMCVCNNLMIIQNIAGAATPPFLQTFMDQAEQMFENDSIERKYFSKP
jgi:hypothetical protein